LNLKIKENEEIDLIAEMNEKLGKRMVKRVILYKILEEKSKKKNKPKVIMIVWKTGLFEEDVYKHDKFK
jgi:hypothetical protein